MKIHPLTTNGREAVSKYFFRTSWKPALVLTALFCCVSCQQQQQPIVEAPPNWRNRLRQELPALGHRNWIVVADAAYPKQSAPGIETLVTGAGQLEVLQEVLSAIEKAPHVRAVVMLDQELDNVAETDATGVEDYRQALQELFSQNEPKMIPHEDIIRDLDEASKLFNVLLLKTKMTIPYTSVFLQLDCGYWDAEKEARLRDSLE